MKLHLQKQVAGWMQILAVFYQLALKEGLLGSQKVDS